MNEQDNWVPEESQAPPDDQPFGVGNPPPTFASRTATPGHACPQGGSAAAMNIDGTGFRESNGRRLSVVEGLSIAWTKTREHLLEWLFFTVVLGGLTFALAWVSIDLQAVSPLEAESFEDATRELGGEILLEIWLLICGAMAVQAALEMMRGRQVRFLAFFRVVNPLTILVLAAVFGTVSASLIHFLHGGVYPAMLVDFIAFLAMAGAIDSYDGPPRAVGRALAFFAEAPLPMTRLLVGTVVFTSVFGFFPVIGGIIATAIFALLVAYGFRTMTGHSPR